MTRRKGNSELVKDWLEIALKKIVKIVFERD